MALELTVSDENKQLLLSNSTFVPYVLDALLLDPAHPRAGNSPEVKAWCQTHHTHCAPSGTLPTPFGILICLDASQISFRIIGLTAQCVHVCTGLAQLAMHPPSREALLQDASVTPALQAVAEDGFSEEARDLAAAALAALSDKTLTMVIEGQKRMASHLTKHLLGN